MKSSFGTWGLLMAALGGVACEGTTDPAEDNTVDSAMDTAVEDTAAVITIPDPGTEYAPDRWYDDGGSHGTPQTAQVMGVVLDSPSYLQGGIDPETGYRYFVFRTAPNVTEFIVALSDKSSKIESVKMYDGTGLIFGEKVAAKNVIGPKRKRWELNPDSVYVLEVFSPIGGFF